MWLEIGACLATARDERERASPAEGCWVTDRPHRRRHARSLAGFANGRRRLADGPTLALILRGQRAAVCGASTVSVAYGLPNPEQAGSLNSGLFVCVLACFLRRHNRATIEHE